MQKKLTKRELILLAIFIELLLVAMIVNYWYFPFLERKEMLILEKESLQQQSAEMAAYKDKVAELQDSVAIIESNIKMLRAQIPAYSSSHSYWETLLQIARKSNVDLVLLAERDILQEEHRMDATVGLTGGYSDSLLFLDQLKALPYLYSVTEGSITEVDDGKMTSTISLQFYFEKKDTSDPIRLEK